MFKQALWRLILIDVAIASGAVVLLLIVAFLLIRSNLERSAFSSLEDAAETVAMSDLHELFDDDEPEHRDTSTVIGEAISYWIVGLNGHVFAASTRNSFSQQPLSVSLDNARNGEIDRTVVATESGDIRGVTLPRLSESPPYLIQVVAPDTVGPDLGPILVSLLITGLVGVALATAVGGFVARRTLAPVQLAFELQRDFISGASHELRTPVAVVQANADAIQRLVPDLGSEDAQILEDIQLESTFLGQLIGRLAELSRLQGTEIASLETVDIGQLNLDLARSMELLVTNAGMSIAAEASDEKFLAKADRIMLRQVVQSLVDNSVKYAGSGSTIELLARVNDGVCELVVRDNGTGISSQHLPYVTERFYRADKARSRKAGGSGLGLAIAREALRSMGGDFAIQSAEGLGTTVTISLDAAVSSADSFGVT